MDRGRVKKIEGDFAFIEMEINASCRSCSNKGVCMVGDEPALLKFDNTIGLNEGDRVEIDLLPQTKISAGFLLFIFPLISLIIGYYIGFSIEPTENAGMIGALIGLIFGVIDLIIFNRFIAKTRHFKPRSIRKV